MHLSVAGKLCACSEYDVISVGKFFSLFTGKSLTLVLFEAVFALCSVINGMTSPHEDRRVANRSSSRRHSAQVPAVSGGGERNNETNEERRPAALSSGRGRSSSSNRSPPVARGQRHVGQWTEKQLLGSGGFGQVILWQNEVATGFSRGFFLRVAW